MKELNLLCVLMVVVFPYPWGGTSRIKIVNNAYEGIVVAFDPDTKENEGRPLIENIRKLFTDASPILFEATKRRSYFGHVTILVPKSWQKRPEYERVNFENFGEADVKITDPNPMYGDGPNTIQPYPCGHPGLHIHLTPNYLKYLDGNSTTVFGNPAKTLVHEWAHLRYGVFDEFGQTRDQTLFPLFYYDSLFKEILPNACTNQELQGSKWDPINNKGCNFVNGIPDKNCIFIPDANSAEATSSLGSFHYLPKVHVFCDDTEDNYHNKRAPNKHNFLCNSKSMWEIISSHADFAGTNNGPMIGNPNLIPRFTIVQQAEETYSLVLDVSTSMRDPQSYSKLQMMKNVIEQWLKVEVKSGNAVGLVTFSSKTVYEGPMKVIDSTSRDQLISVIRNLIANGGTCIGCGLQAGLQQLKNYRNSLGGTIILLTDGEENANPRIETVQPMVVNAQVRVITIAFSDQASNKIEQLAQATGGKAYFVRLKDGEPGLGSAFLDAITYQTADFDLPVKISDETFDEPQNVYEGSFSIDSTVGKSTTVSFLYAEPNDIKNVQITGPNLQITSEDASTSDKTITKDTFTKTIRFQFSLLQPGKYNYTINRNSPSDKQKVTVSVSSKAAASGIKPIITTCRTEYATINNKPVLLINAAVKQGNSPVIKATVVAKIDRPNADSITLQLFDNGNGNPDMTKDDGYYTRFFTEFTGKGRYSIKAQVIGDTQTSIQDEGFIASQSMPIVNAYMAKRRVSSKPSGAFERTASGGTINLEENIHQSSGDHFPPNRVVDLRAIQVDLSNFKISLQWTAPGDDLDVGNASFYEIFYSKSWDQLFDNFTGIPILEQIVPNEAGSEEKYEIDIVGARVLDTYYFALRAYDDRVQSSATSNIAQVTISTHKSTEQVDKSLGIILGIVFGIIGIVGLIVLVVFCCRRRKKKVYV